jgi:agmatinase
VLPVETLARLLRPAGGGVHLVSTGRAEQLALQQKLYGATTEAEVGARWRAELARAATARAVLLGIPSDAGGGFQRGANLGPAAIRARLLQDHAARLARAREAGLVELGDVLVVPQLLHDEMLSDAQRAATAAALHPDLSAEARAALPVSPLSVARHVLELVLAVNPRAKVIALGGDHSTAWPVVEALAGVRPGLGVVQVDAHTDLLPERLGVRYCFGTWSFHASRLLGPARLVQVGIRASGHDRSHWERTVGVRQLWAKEVLADPAAALEAVVAQLRAAGATSVYFSNDVDGTDEAYADATGTPEPGGLEPSFVSALVRRLSADFELAGGDVMEVAPLVARSPGGGPRTVGLAAEYLMDTVEATLASR